MNLLGWFITTAVIGVAAALGASGGTIMVVAAIGAIAMGVLIANTN